MNAYQIIGELRELVSALETELKKKTVRMISCGPTCKRSFRTIPNFGISWMNAPGTFGG